MNVSPLLIVETHHNIITFIKRSPPMIYEIFPYLMKCFGTKDEVEIYTFNIAIFCINC